MRHLLKAARQRLVSDQSGSVLIEALVSGTLLVIVAVGVLGGFETANRSTSEERHRARAQSIAQDDLARLRAMSISDLASMQTETRNVPVEGTTYVVTSTREFLTDATGTASCTPGTSSADYIRVSSSVTWPTRGSRPPVVATTLVAPPAGSISPDSGALAIALQDAGGQGIAGIGVAGSGAGSFSGTTGPGGCIIFGNLPAGNYTVNLTGIGGSLVDFEGDPPEPQTTSVVAEATNTLVLQYDDPGELPVRFTTRNYANAVVPSAADSIVAFHNGMQTAGNVRTFGNPVTTPPTQSTEISAEPMFPFTSPYTAYAGTCTGNNPTSASPTAPLAAGSATVPPGGVAPAITVQLPALHITVWRGTSGSPGTVSNGATIKLRDESCGDFLRTFLTNSSGQLSNPGLPYSEQDICVHGVSTAGVLERVEPPDVFVRSTSGINPTNSSSGTGWRINSSGLHIYLRDGSTSSGGDCP
jgi:Tfp pilus assembly protein PilV